MHKVRVDNGKYEFRVLRDGQIDIHRYGELWCSDVVANNAVFALVCELDAARVVLAEARRLADAGEAPIGLRDALAKHDRLADDRESPSEWTR